MNNKLNNLFIENNKIKIKCFLPEEVRAETIFYSFSESKFGDLIIASTSKGICYIGFSEKRNEAIELLKNRFSAMRFCEQKNNWINKLEDYIIQNKIEDLEINLHLLGTEFQLKVWRTLLEIPKYVKVTYADVAKKIGNPKANRAVGSAVSKNPITLVIPCHRVVSSSGKIGNYFWGEHKKREILEIEGLV